MWIMARYGGVGGGDLEALCSVVLVVGPCIFCVAYANTFQMRGGDAKDTQRVSEWLAIIVQQAPSAVLPKFNKIWLSFSATTPRFTGSFGWASAHWGPGGNWLTGNCSMLFVCGV